MVILLVKRADVVALMTSQAVAKIAKVASISPATDGETWSLQATVNTCSML